MNVPIATEELPPLAPLEALRAAIGEEYVLLHSSAGGMSVLGVSPYCRVVIDSEGNAQAEGPPEFVAQLAGAAGESVLAPLERAAGWAEFVPPHPLVGWMGFVSYDVGRHLERVPGHASDELRWPVACFTLFREYLLFEPAGPVRRVRLGPDSSSAGKTIDWHRASDAGGSPQATAACVEQQSRADFEDKVRQVKQYIAAGDIYQANLAQRWVYEAQAAPEDVFARLCRISPAPYAACLRFAHAGVTRHVVSASPELFLTVQDRHAVTRPIKGTRPRDLCDAARDAAQRDDLLRSPKDAAELAMIVDLLRNDLGRVSDFGSVAVEEARTMEQHPTIWHTVATIRSRLRAEAGLAEVLAAVCPGGSITGAPKIRAMQLIEELEGFRRGLYCGNIGVIGPGGKAVALNIAIRTMLFQQGRAYLYAGGGIVAESDPGMEYEETLHKAAAMRRALEG